MEPTPLINDFFKFTTPFLLSGLLFFLIRFVKKVDVLADLLRSHSDQLISINTGCKLKHDNIKIQHDNFTIQLADHGLHLHEHDEIIGKHAVELGEIKTQIKKPRSHG